MNRRSFCRARRLVGSRISGPAERVRNSREAATRANDGSGCKAPEIERVQIQHISGLRVSRQEHLEATVQLKPVDAIGAHASPDVAVGLQQ
jgi:hypothetical protein